LETVVKLRIGTDKEFLKGNIDLREKGKNGRPRVNRQLAMALIKAGYSTHYIRRRLRCSAKTIQRIKKEMLENGEVNQREIDLSKIDRLSLQFDDQAVQAVGISFYDWLKNRTKKYKSIFSFCERVWDQVFDRTPLMLIKDQNSNAGDQVCMKFLNVFGEDRKRIRNRKKTIRFLFRFLGRTDLCNRYLSMSEARDPRPIREIPELTMLDFPVKLNEAIKLVGQQLGKEAETALKFKIVTQMRTGKASEERELFGLKKDEGNSYMTFENPDSFRGEVKAKRNLKWIIEWIPEPIRKDLYRFYQEKERGEQIFNSFNSRQLSKAFIKACEQVGLPPLKLHDLRKVSITWLWAMGIELSIATELNVGWKDLNTAKTHYLRNSEILKKKERRRYRENIPKWFKDGLEDYIQASIPFEMDELIRLVKKLTA